MSSSVPSRRSGLLASACWNGREVIDRGGRQAVDDDAAAAPARRARLKGRSDDAYFAPSYVPIVPYIRKGMHVAAPSSAPCSAAELGAT